ncbi:GNAT family N-acetyltransferase [Microbacterium indicum]|uniref:GNAT family N-acetyltransferase n=1 Tax=Microbacterium indicum TaxID=358100 RepID=UPI0003FB0F24|nr:GNAT family N-acetyltransferase [Microbacterium indicum]
MATTVRAVARADEARWTELFHGYRDFYGMERSDEVARTVWSWIADPTHELECAVAESDGEVIAIADWRRFARPSRGGAAIFLDDLFTDPATRGSGAGSALIEHLRAIAAEEGLLEVRWITSETNADARRLYDRVAGAVPFVTYVSAV